MGHPWCWVSWFTSINHTFILTQQTYTIHLRLQKWPGRQNRSVLFIYYRGVIQNPFQHVASMLYEGMNKDTLALRSDSLREQREELHTHSERPVLVLGPC